MLWTPKNRYPRCRVLPLSLFLFLLTLVLVSCYSNAFLFNLRTPDLQRDHGGVVRLFARGRKLKKAAQQSGKQKVVRVEHKKTKRKNASSTVVSSASSVPRPTSTRRVVITLDRAVPVKEKPSPLRVCAIQVDDSSWWEHSENSNPYGAKLWPSAMGVAQFLVGLGPFDASQVILELGCGCGLVSIVAAQNGASVVATDISNLVLSLTRDGWQETKNLPTAHKHEGSLSVRNFDLCSSQPLPLTLPTINTIATTAETAPSITTSPRPIVIAAAMMYEAELAEALARRAVEAVNLGAWVIVGDDDTGERENGRQKFEAELDRLLLSNDSKPVARAWKSSTVKYTALGWNEKRVKLLHLNAPPGTCLE